MYRISLKSAHPSHFFFEYEVKIIILTGKIRELLQSRKNLFHSIREHRLNLKEIEACTCEWKEEEASM